MIKLPARFWSSTVLLLLLCQYLLVVSLSKLRVDTSRWRSSLPTSLCLSITYGGE